MIYQQPTSDVKPRFISFQNQTFLAYSIVLCQQINRKFNKKLNTCIETPTPDKFVYISIIENLKYLCGNLKFQKELVRKNS